MGVNAPLKERGSVYGDPKENLSVSSDLCAIYNRAVAAKMQVEGKVGFTKEEAAHHMSMIMTLSKIARVATGKFCEDNYIDAIGYLEIARKLAKGEDTSPENI